MNIGKGSIADSKPRKPSGRLWSWSGQPDGKPPRPSINGRLSLVVDGYNDDPRELFEIPEVRAYIKRLEQEWPYWFFFLSQGDESIKLLESCLCETIEVVPGVTSVDMEQLELSLARHFGAMYRLGDELGLPEEMCEELAEEIVSMFQNATVERIEGDEYR